MPALLPRPDPIAIGWSEHEPDISSGEVKRKAGRNLNNCTEFALQIIKKKLALAIKRRYLTKMKYKLVFSDLLICSQLVSLFNPRTACRS